MNMCIYERMSDTNPIADRRKALGISQEQLATLLGITQGTVSRNETAADPDRRYLLSLDALAARKEQGEDLAETARQMTEAEAVKAA